MNVFRPVSDDHAVDSVAFQLLFDGILVPSMIAPAQAVHPQWSDELPALHIGPLHDGDQPESLFSPSVTFSYLRPNGSAAWQLKFEGNMLSVTCSRYTRWDRVWTTAKGYLRRALELVSKQDSLAQRKILVARMQVVDRFDTVESDYDARHLFGNSDLLPAAMFAKGPVWHSNSGWFEERPVGLVLNNLNVASNRLLVTAKNTASIGVLLTHIQELRVKVPWEITDIQKLADDLDEAMSDLHQGNKALVTGMLTRDVLEQIGLVAASTKIGSN